MYLKKFLFAVALLLTSAASLLSNVTDKSFMMAEKYDPENHRKLLYEKVCKALTEKFKMPCNATWSLERFMHQYLDEAGAYVIYRTPEKWTIKTPSEHYEETQDLDKHKIDVDNTRRFMTYPEGLTFKDFIEKYEPTTVWEQAMEEAKMVGRNNTDRSSLIKGLDSTDELLSLWVPHSGRRWWNNQWRLPQLPHKPSLKQKKDADLNDMYVILYFMKQDIYQAREKMRVMQTLREKYRKTALYKIGYLFGKTDYACKVFSSLAYKSFRECSTIRIHIYAEFRLFIHMLDIAYNIERLICRWFDVDILKDLIVSNDVITRKVILKNKNLTTLEAIKAFDDMFID